MTAVLLYLRVSLGVLFLVAGTSKLFGFRDFKDAVANFQIIPRPAAPHVALLVLTLELASAGLLLSGFLEWLGALVLAGLLVGFNVALVVNLVRGRQSLDCRCFGRPTPRIGWGHVAQNSLLLAMAAVLAAFSWRSPAQPPDLAPMSLTLPVLMGLHSAVLFLSAQEIAVVRAGLIRLFGRQQVELR